MRLSLAGVALASSLAHTAAAADFYHLKREVPVASEGAAYDYVAFRDSKLYVGHRPDGLQVFDTTDDFRMTRVEDSKGSNGAMLMPDLGLGVSHNTDGTLTLFTLADSRMVRKIKVGAEADSSRYDPVTHRLAVFGVPSAGGPGADVVVFQAPAMEKVGVIRSTAGKLEHSVADGAGGIFVTGQDIDAVVRLDMRDLRQTDSFATPCTQPTGLDLDAAHNRLMVACRGQIAAPSFAVLDSGTGAIVFKAPISPGNDGLVFDAKRGRVLMTNGVGANLVVFTQTGADDYALEQVVGTRPMAKTMALDPSTGEIYTITAEGVYDVSRKNLAYVAPFYPNAFTPGSFRILQYGF